MASPAKYDWTIWVRSDDLISFTFKDDNGARIDLTGDIYTFAVEFAGEQSSLILTTGENSEIEIADQTEPTTKGILTIKLTLEQKKMFSVYSNAKYQLEKTLGGDTTVIIYGEITAVNWVSHPNA